MKHVFSLLAFVLMSSGFSIAFGQESCPNLFDSNSNGAVDIEDFLAVLSLFSDVDSDSDGIWDSQDACIDLEACNYAASPSEPCAYLDVLGACGGGCEGDGDGDGICDDVDTCVGELDECGICNGPGPTEVVIEDITILYDSVFLPLDNDWYVFPISADTTFSFTCTPSFSQCGDPLTYQGYDYATVQIGEQCWLAENLRNENYSNGEPIVSSLTAPQWTVTNDGAWAVYGEGNTYCVHASPDGDACDEAWSQEEFGLLYNWYAVDDCRGLCPSGWHVPNDGEWMTLVQQFGGMSEAGEALKATYSWQNEGNGTDSSGFTGLAAGVRASSDGEFEWAGDYGYWWSSSSAGGQATYWRLRSDDSQVYQAPDQRDGFSIRCMQNQD